MSYTREKAGLPSWCVGLLSIRVVCPSLLGYSFSEASASFIYLPYYEKISNECKIKENNITPYPHNPSSRIDQYFAIFDLSISPFHY